MASAAGSNQTPPACHSERSEESRPGWRWIGARKTQSEIPRCARNDMNLGWLAPEILPPPPTPSSTEEGDLPRGLRRLHAQQFFGSFIEDCPRHCQGVVPRVLTVLDLRGKDYRQLVEFRLQAVIAHGHFTF